MKKTGTNSRWNVREYDNEEWVRELMQLILMLSVFHCSFLSTLRDPSFLYFYGHSVWVLFLLFFFTFRVCLLNPRVWGFAHRRQFPCSMAILYGSYSSVFSPHLGSVCQILAWQALCIVINFFVLWSISLGSLPPSFLRI